MKGEDGFKDILNTIETEVVGFMDNITGRTRAMDVTKKDGEIVYISNHDMSLNQFESEEDFQEYVENSKTSYHGVKEKQASMFTEVNLFDSRQNEYVKKVEDGYEIKVDELNNKVFIPQTIRPPLEDSKFRIEKSYVLEENASNNIIISVYYRDLDNYFRVIKKEDDKIWNEVIEELDTSVIDDYMKEEIHH